MVGYFKKPVPMLSALWNAPRGKLIIDTSGVVRSGKSREERNAKGGIIYSLHDPVTDELRYIGYTTTKPEQRLRGHLGDIARLARIDPDAKAWHAQMNKLGLHPVMRLVEEVQTGILDAEIYWIRRHVYTGYNLVNVQHHPFKRSPKPFDIVSERPGYSSDRVKALEKTFGTPSYDPTGEIRNRIVAQIKKAGCTNNYPLDLYIQIALAAHKTGETGIASKKINQLFSKKHGRVVVSNATFVLRSCRILYQIRTATDKWWDDDTHMPLDYCPLVHSEFHREWMGDIVERRLGR